MKNLKQILNEEIFKIDDKEERDYFKKTFNEAFVALTEHSLERINAIENRVLETQNRMIVENPIYTTLMTDNQLRLYDSYFTPVFYTDNFEKLSRYEELREDINDRKQIIIDTFPIILPEKYKRDIENVIFEGTLNTIPDLLPFKFKLVKSKKYKEILENMYHVHQNNRLKWITPNIPYLNCMYDLIILDYENYDIYVNKIFDIYYNFKELEKFVYKDHVLVWNIEKRIVENINFPRPLEDGINYQHVLNFNSKKNILVESDENEIFLVNYDDKNRVNVISKVNKEQKWRVWHIHGVPDRHRNFDLDFKIYSNEKVNDTLEILSRKHGQVMRSVSEVKRIILSFIDLKVFKLLEVYPKRVGADYLELEDLNYFLEDEFKYKSENRQIITLRFKVLDYNEPFKDELMSFIVSELENIYREFNFKVAME